MDRFPYRVNRTLRRFLMYGVKRFVHEHQACDSFDVLRERINKILLVRTTFRIGDSILSSPAILMFRKRFPNARIDFVGGPISKVVFQNLPYDRHYVTTRHFPHAAWSYLGLLREIRSVGYDLAVELSCSHSAMGAFIVGFSGARFKAGAKGKRDFFYNVKMPKPPPLNKYETLKTFLGSINLHEDALPAVVLSATEAQSGAEKMRRLVGNNARPIAGVFIGARQTWGKRWPKENFFELINGLYTQGLKVVVFAGPEEKDLMDFFQHRLPQGSPFVCEPRLRTFAAMLSTCALFIACDSGPMHLACALGVRTVGIFQKTNFHRWGPPPQLGAAVYKPAGVAPSDVLEASLRELAIARFRSGSGASTSESLAFVRPRVQTVS